ncbi:MULTISPECIES: error-prone DNA polymerase [unclassified Polaromonas]|jgi:error-prone DNA polymerase|uniref:error-prone DNA polymerase n=1 Tax=unclassified Polaromonas TaxID=2638319 RepID=UPI0025ED75FA|nr:MULTISPECIES: error-prone DNA polymerase [unclassified Polaromonas]HQR97217.1 error-prone DNA polymerase [Polaromonas sp.]HQS40561.1 error-prone DNA polymerase [Polaromonas sp.]HQS85304.1 error-prone DNA polymerase [Polaromonas sp.]HQT06076.1 error-prone DNA polymerase [Polaromonas sp.]
MFSGPLPDYAELHALSNFSFQRGASHAEELVERAAGLGYRALAITDECSVAGVVRAHVAAKKHGLKLLPGAEFFVQASPPFRLVVLPHNATGWGNLCEFITAAKQAGDVIDKGSYRVALGESDFSLLADCEVLLLPLPDAIDTEALCAHAAWAAGLFGMYAWLAVELLQGLDDALRLLQLQTVAQRTGIRLVAAGGVRMHVRSRKPLHDVMTAIKLGKTVHECGFALQANAEAHLRPRMRLADLYPAGLLRATLAVAARCNFSLDEIRDLYRYPLGDMVPEAETPAQCLRRLTAEGARERYPGGVPEKIQTQIDYELVLIEELGYEMYFITVHDIVRFARQQGILCQGRGSAANSAVCFCLGVTAVNPAESQLLFERFISRERREPPDIDVDFEHQRREEVIQYIYAKYGHDRAAIAATVISYRPRSAIRDVGKALGVAPELVEQLAKEHFWFDGSEALEKKLAEAGLQQDPGPVLQWLDLSVQLIGFPRHLSQHVGGFVLTQGKLTRLVPVQPASMEARRIIQWDKDDLDAMGLLKVDVLALGMLSAIRRCLQLVDQLRGGELQMHQIAGDDKPTYDMICAADTVGVFQIESRAQMSMLPRLQPRNYYDLVVEVAIVRPGPIQGGMVHPYLRNREMVRKGGDIAYPYPELKDALGRTLGVPIFQEQVMQIAMIAAKFTADEADDLRRSMAAWKRKGGVERFHDRLVNAMTARGYDATFSENIFSQIRGFGEYGFPESHAASFAKLVYVSCWLKCHEPACFLAAMLNSQPMGFYAPSQLVQDARRHGVAVRAVDVTCSAWDCTLEKSSASSEAETVLPEHLPVRVDALSVRAEPVEVVPEEHRRTLRQAQGERIGSQPERRKKQPAVRLGLRLVAGLPEAAALRITQARALAPFTSTEDLVARAQLGTREINALAAADALRPLAGHRRQQVWEASAIQPAPALLKAVPTHETSLVLPETPEGENILFDYQSTGLTLRRHPLALLRPRLARRGLLSAGELNALPSGREVAACGIVTVRQQPQTAKGTIFVTLEDETGPVNVIVWKSLRDTQRHEVLHARLLAVYGVWQRSEESDTREGYGAVRNLVAHRLEDLTPLLGRLGTSSRDFH